MPDFSVGRAYAWRTAANEAVRTRYEFIEPEHLFVGVCKLGNLLSLDGWNEIGIPRDAVVALKTETEIVAAVFQKAGHDRAALYRDVRKRLGDGSFADKG